MQKLLEFCFVITGPQQGLLVNYTTTSDTHLVIIWHFNGHPRMHQNVFRFNKFYVVRLHFTSVTDLILGNRISHIYQGYQRSEVSRLYSTGFYHNHIYGCQNSAEKIANYVHHFCEFCPTFQSVFSWYNCDSSVLSRVSWLIGPMNLELLFNLHSLK